MVIKIGTSSLTLPDGGLDEHRIRAVAAQIGDLRRDGKDVVLVTSGAIGVGSRRLGLTERPRTIPHKQAAAAVGQGLLMQAYEQAFLEQNLIVGQVLLTAEDVADRRRHLNSRNTLLALLEFGTVPIVNENDTVAVDEIRFGDNDTLSALVATLIGADVLIVLSDVDGLYTGDPRTDPKARRISAVERVTEAMIESAGGAGSAFSTGGMVTKLQAARIVTAAGIPMLLTDGSRPGIVAELLSGADVGTLFLPGPRPLPARKRWLAFYERPRGRIVVDGGAARALAVEGGSLLAAGIVSVEGRFEPGDLVLVYDGAGLELGRGLVNYGADDVRRIRGRRTGDIAALLGRKDYDEVIHRDNFALNPHGAVEAE